VTEQTQTRPDAGKRESKQVFVGRHLANIKLTAPGSGKETRHHAISMSGAPVTYRPGDAVGVHPRNDPAIVDRILEAVQATGDELVSDPHGELLPLRQALLERYTLTTPSRRLLELMAGRGATELAPLLEHANTAQLKQYLSGPDAHDVLDVLECHREVGVSATELVSTLRSLLPRLYSIASSLRAHPDEVHVLVVTLTFEVRGRRRAGVSSTWLNDRWPVGDSAEMYLQNQQAHFAMPPDPTTPMIMIGPGTGLAPFRAFLEERRVTGATGPNWLFFGEQRRDTDFYYEAELTELARDGFLRLDTAFSRDQAEKIYVQHRMRQQARDIWDWLEAGAELFVCGDKARMAADVDRELHTIVETIGGRTADAAKDYVQRLKAAKRYKRDVY
jgi:sulfite reductase (NADPH) flavoprotein alpha-component